MREFERGKRYKVKTERLLERLQLDEFCYIEPDKETVGQIGNCWLMNKDGIVHRTIWRDMPVMFHIEDVEEDNTGQMDDPGQPVREA